MAKLLNLVQQALFMWYVVWRKRNMRDRFVEENPYDSMVY